MRIGYTISLALNAALAAIVMTRWRAASTSVVTMSPASPVSAVSQPHGGLGAPPIESVRIGGDWRHWIEPLRGAGVPPDVLASLVQSDFDRRWQTRQAALQAGYQRGEINSDALAAAGLEHDVELQREVQAALGPDAYHTWDQSRVLQGLNVDAAGLSDRERDAVYDLERHLRDTLRQAELDKLHGTIDLGTFNERQQGEQDTVAQKLRTLLGEQRAAQLQGMDDTMGALRRAWHDTPLAPHQLDALAAVERTWDRTRADLVNREVNTGDPVIADEIRANDEQRRIAFEQIAGPAALDQYTKSQDSRYVDLSHNAARWGLTSDAVDPVYTAIRNFEDAVQTYRRDADQRGIDPALRDAAIGHLQQTAEQALATQLGTPVYDQLKRNGVGMVAAP